MGFLIDTNVVSELRKGDRCHPQVAAWFESLTDQPLFLSCLSLGEIRQGIETKRRRNPEQAQALERWLQSLETHYADRVLPITPAIADCWGRLNAQRTFPVIDGLLAATALVHGLTLVTRNVADVQGSGVEWFDPFVHPEGRTQ
jgi:predicted nucleic acid-binding protein